MGAAAGRPFVSSLCPFSSRHYISTYCPFPNCVQFQIPILSVIWWVSLQGGWKHFLSDDFHPRKVDFTKQFIIIQPAVSNNLFFSYGFRFNVCSFSPAAASQRAREGTSSTSSHLSGGRWLLVNLAWTPGTCTSVLPAHKTVHTERTAQLMISQNPPPCSLPGAPAIGLN